MGVLAGASSRRFSRHWPPCTSFCLRRGLAVAADAMSLVPGSLGRSGPRGALDREIDRAAARTSAIANRDGAARGREPAVRGSRAPDSRTRATAYSSFVAKNPREQARLVKTLVSISFDRGSLARPALSRSTYPRNGGKTGEWLLRLDSSTLAERNARCGVTEDRLWSRNPLARRTGRSPQRAGPCGGLTLTCVEHGRMLITCPRWSKSGMCPTPCIAS